MIDNHCSSRIAAVQGVSRGTSARMFGGPSPSSPTVDPEDRDSGSGSGSSAMETRTTADWKHEVEEFRQRLRHSEAENKRKDAIIESLQAKILKEGELLVRTENLQQTINEVFRRRDDPVLGAPENKVRDIVDAIQQWLFLEGGNLRDVESLITQYCIFCRSIGIPVDRVFIAGMMLHPNVSAYVWKWEIGEEFNEHEVPSSAFVKPNYNPEEPFALLMEGRAFDYRMNAKSDNIPKGCAWFRESKYQDYFALPIYHQGEFKGAMAWSTRSNEGWSKEHIQIFEHSLAALSTVLRLHTNEIVLATLVGRLEEEVNLQTQELAATNASLEEANQRIILQSQAQLKNFAIMSHEIRTPLNCIVGISDLLLNSSLDASMKESIEMITSSSDLLLAVVDDVLDYSKLATGNVKAVMRSTNLRTIVNTVASSVQTKASLSGIQLRTNMSKELPDMIQTDGRRLQQILYNLLGNAIKFGKRGEFVDFHIDMVHDAETTTNAVQFSVKDYGKGLSTQDQKCIFEPFQQAASNEGLHGGTGLGLTITCELVRVLGGTISVESEYGNWCEFRVRLPLYADSEFASVVNDSNNNEEKTLTNPSALPDNFEHLNVLIAEDNLINQKVLRRSLENIGIKNIDIVDNGEKAVKVSATMDYDIIFMDLQMPVMDGFEATRIISGRRRNGHDAKFPVIAILTAHAIEDFQQKAEEAGGDGFISKPFKVDTIKNLFRRFQLQTTESCQL